MLFKSRFW